ncbi:MAG: hypothetical protein KGM24_13615 [Elusimicrobia bacterium]|nr:hypothetical protein [Elusimicrobiota bacterium]
MKILPPRTAHRGAPRGVGALLRDSLELALDGLATYAALVVALMLPLGTACVWIIIRFGLTSARAVRLAWEAGQSGRLLAIGAVSAALFAASLLFNAAKYLDLDARARNAPLGAEEAMRRGAGLILPLAAVTVLDMLAILAGLLLLVVPGVVALLRFLLVAQALILENRRGLEAFRRSNEIMAAHVGKVVGNLFVMIVVMAASDMILKFGAVLGVVALMLLLRPPNALVIPFAVAASALFLFLRFLVGVWSSAFKTLLYRDLAALHPAAPAA